MALIRYRVTVRSYNFVTDEIVAPDGITDENLREILFGRVERGEIAWDTDVAETLVVPLHPEIVDTPDRNFPAGVDSEFKD